MIITQTVDISKKVSRYIKYTLIGLLTVSVTMGIGIFQLQHVEDVMIVKDAKLAGTLVSVRVLTDGKVKSLNRADGDPIDAGTVIANLEVSVTEEQLAQLENSVQQAKDNYEQLQQGHWVKVEVRKPVPKTVVRPQTQRRAVSSSSSADLAALAERKDRMEKLYEMGAISRVQRDAAVAEYEMAQASSSTTTYEEVEGEPIVDTEIEYVTEYVDQFQPTPPEILEGAQLAIKQAEMSLNTARQEALQTAVIAPVSGTIYYDVANDQEIKAGAPVAKIGDSQELWLEAEVTEDQFYRLALGKLVSYTIDGQIFNGTVIEKIAPNAYRGVGGPYPVLLAENDPVEPTVDTQQNDPIDQPTDQSDRNKVLDYTQAVDEPFDSSVFEEHSPYEPEPEPKFIVKFSLPTDRHFEYRPNVTADVTIFDPLISWNWIKPLYREVSARFQDIFRQHQFRN